MNTVMIAALSAGGVFLLVVGISAGVASQKLTREREEQLVGLIDYLMSWQAVVIPDSKLHIDLRDHAVTARELLREFGSAEYYDRQMIRWGLKKNPRDAATSGGATNETVASVPRRVALGELHCNYIKPTDTKPLVNFSTNPDRIQFFDHKDRCWRILRSPDRDDPEQDGKCFSVAVRVSCEFGTIDDGEPDGVVQCVFNVIGHLFLDEDSKKNTIQLWSVIEMLALDEQGELRCVGITETE